MKYVVLFLALGVLAAHANAQDQGGPAPAQVTLSQYAGTYTGKTPIFGEKCSVVLTDGSILFTHGDDKDGGQGAKGLTGTIATDGKNSLAHFQISGEEQVTFDLTLSVDSQVTSIKFHSENWDVIIPQINDWTCSSLTKAASVPAPASQQ